jgi:hypothetical protein
MLAFALSKLGLLEDVWATTRSDATHLRQTAASDAVGDRGRRPR